MRITGGRFVRRKLIAPPGKAIRPSTDRTREALFATLDSRRAIDGARVLDIYAGSGALGLEALSRGASQVTFVDSNSGAVSVARRNAEALEVADRCEFIVSDAFRYLAFAAGMQFDLILADPPYAGEDHGELVEILLECLHPEGILALEHSKHFRPVALPTYIETRHYGRSQVSIFSHNPGLVE